MRTQSIALAAVLLLVPQVTLAADFCLTSPPLVGKSFKIPSKGKCKQFVGFLRTGVPGAWTGGACTNSLGTVVHLTVQSLDNFGIESLRIDLSLPALTGSGEDCVADTNVPGGGLSGGVCTSFITDAVACSPSTVPVP